VAVADFEVPARYQAAQLTSPDAAAEEMAAGIKTARLVTVADCGHLSPLERSEAATDALVGWLN